MTPSARTRRPREADARTAALDLLSAVLDRRRPLDEVLDEHAGLAALDSRDRAFARLIVATTLRRLGEIDALIGDCLARPLPARAPEVRQILRLSVAQLVLLDVPAHAAVDRGVDLVRGPRLAPYRGLVNAVLRRLAGEGAKRRAGLDAARLNTPDWLWRSWSLTYGELTCRAIAEAHLVEAPLDITVKGDAASWADRLEANPLPTGTLRRAPGGTVSELAGFAEGAWWVQDAAAALPARLLLGALSGGAVGKRVIDLCAAPGGKTAQLAQAGAEVTAVERSAKRLRRLKENLARLRLAAHLVEADVTEWRPDVPADAVLLDVPCSATGTVRRHPDVAHLKTPSNIESLAAAQQRLLAAAADMVRPGGVLVYCACSLAPEEGPARIKAFLEAGATFAPVPVAAEEVAGLSETLTEAGELRTLPYHLGSLGGMDGFFAARLRRL